MPNINDVIERLRRSERPLIHVGQGVRISGAIESFMAFVEKHGIPFVTARNANDICPTDHPLNIGRPGTFGQRGANFAVQTCDLYIAIGTRLSLPQTGYNSKDYARNAVIVQVDIDQAELDKGTLRDPIRICLDASVAIGSLRSADLGRDWSEWRARCQSLRDRYPITGEDAQKVDTYHFINAVSESLSAGDTVVTDMGTAFQITHQAFKVKRGQRLMTNCGLAPMGWGLPAAVGAAFATGGRVICITGDGGLMMNIQELATIAHHKLPIKIFVLNNGGYVTIKQTQQLGFDGRLMGVNGDTGVSFPVFSAVARAHEIWDMATMRNESVANAIEMTLQHDGPACCELMCNPDQPQAPRSLNRRNVDGTMNPTKLEDAYPFLDPEVIAKEMLI
jgi:acetolactate synthase-1/2/3 large subunit